MASHRNAAQAEGYKDFEIVVRLKMEKEKFLEMPIEIEPGTLPPPNLPLKGEEFC